MTFQIGIPFMQILITTTRHYATRKINIQENIQEVDNKEPKDDRCLLALEWKSYRS